MSLVEEALAAELPKAAIDFFVVFSRFECALKRSGACLAGVLRQTSKQSDRDEAELHGRKLAGYR